MTKTEELLARPPKELGALLGVTVQSIYSWRRQTGFKFDAQYVRRLCARYKCRPFDLRPDLYEKKWKF